MLLQVKEKDKRLECNALGADDLKKSQTTSVQGCTVVHQQSQDLHIQSTEETNIPNKNF